MSLLGFHVTTEKKLDRYEHTGAILPPVRFWPNLYTAERWQRRTGRSVILAFDRPAVAYPLPDHKPALWTPALVRDWQRVQPSHPAGDNETGRP